MAGLRSPVFVQEAETQLSRKTHVLAHRSVVAVR